MSAPPALEITGLTKSFGPTRALDEVALRVEAGTVHCVLGENGAGKSTLCHLVGGGLTPDAGTMRLYGQRYAPTRPADALAAGIATVHQHFSLVPTLTVAENLLLPAARSLRLPRRALAALLDALEEAYGLGVDPAARVDGLPVGIRQRVEIVKCLLHEPRLLLLDEPTGVLAPAEVDALLDTCRRIAADGRAVVLITHKLGEAARAGDAATVLRGGRVAGSAPLAELPAKKLVPLMIGRAPADLAPALAATLGLEPAPGADPAPAPAAAAGAGAGADVPAPAGPPALRLRGVSVRRGDGSPALDGVGLDLAPGEILGIAGVEGNGQSELMAVLGGALAVESGCVEAGGVDLTRATPRTRTAAGLGIVPEDRHHEGCVPELSVAENLFLGRLDAFRRFGVLLDRPAMHRAAGRVLTEYAVRAAGPGAPMSSLSGGNQQKVVLARELALDPLVCLAAAQPTRGLDVGAVDAVLGRLREAAARGAGVLVVSSELDELLAVCDRIAVAYRGRLLGPVRTDDPEARSTVSRLMLGADGSRPLLEAAS
ncbi:ABC transporter ATP-binding protein [Streptomyces sp. ITFR-16]|uniref:ABC transporter ATP-binding protein n=1 Tax=Streptomyces sp. ITFR-16 TaxID=3075198 RepID=UPI00288BA1E0|nr:ABC transporter ATP-binding protein [Streptomyces sp. ITFR-16]WNI24396.1 ABC transporter ATP-binding protein [Streptomyces sp. ITFR-16]